MAETKLAAVAVTVLALLLAGSAMAQDKPNILIIWGDDIGPYNISAYNMGIMGYKTPNIDRLADEGIIFTDAYADQSCTAGRASFITGQHPMRTGLTKVGLPSAKLTLHAAAVTDHVAGAELESGCHGGGEYAI